MGHYPKILERTAFVLDCEHMATVLAVPVPLLLGMVHTNTDSPRSVELLNAGDTLVRMVMETIYRYGLVAAVIPNTQFHLGDIGPLETTKIPCFTLIDTTELSYHVSDGLDLITPQGLERATRAYAYLMDRVDETPLANLRRN
jgi:hypothetical protein